MNQTQRFTRDLEELFSNQKLCVVSTQSAKGPYASLVAFWAAGENPSRIIFFTPRSTRKYANLSADARVAVLLQNAVNRESDFHSAVAVTGTGEAVEIDKEAHRPLLQHYLQKHPYMEEFVHSPSCAMIAVTVTRYVMVRNFQNVTELHLEDEMDSAG
jgi:general stress protein 26